MSGLRGLRVLDFSTRIAGPYASKLLADAGACVVKVEPPSGDPLRRWAMGRELAPDEDGALFRFLAGRKRSVVGEPGDAAVDALVAGADLVIESFEDDALGGAALAERHPGLVVLSISPWGRSGPWRDRPWSELTLQAQSGSLATRGLPGGEPFQAGGRITEWVAGTYAAVAAAAALRRARASGAGAHLDFSLHELMNIVGTNYLDLTFRLLGVDPKVAPAATVETPSIEPTADGYVGFCTNSRQQVSDFMLLIERPDLREDEGLAQVAGRMARLAEWNAIVHAWTKRHTTAEIVERASLLRIPVAPVNDGERVRHHEQLRARGVFRKHPDGDFFCPRPPYRLNDVDPPEPARAPKPGEHTGAVRWDARPREGAATPGASGAEEPPALPLAGLRVLDMTAWWAGPSATQMLALLGADVVHVESTTRIDGMRSVGGMAAHRFPDWWEASSFYQGANTGKRGLTLDLATEEGLAVMRRLVASSDALFENFTPRVLDGFGLHWENLRALNPRFILVRMPAFGLSGPWRDHTGFAQTMEQLSGLAWVTGHPDDQPRIQRGPCDPLAGMHAAFAFLVALGERQASGRGQHVECTMVEGALNAAAEQLIEFTAYGHTPGRMGNRSPHAAPQGLYPARGHTVASPRWLALSVETDAQWRALVRLLGEPGWSRDAALSSLAGRHAAHDAIDDALRAWTGERELDDAVQTLLAAGVPAAPLADPRRAGRCPQHRARGFYEVVEHPVTGAHPVPTLPFRLSGVERWVRRPAPTLGQHSREVLHEWLGMDDPALDALEGQGVIGTRPAGV
ncbi:MAG: CaiB/BaiF CoA transferase family protein [Myxococcota bacterium]